MAGPGVDRGARVPLHRQHIDSVLAQEQRGRQADQAAADDQYGHILAGSARVAMVRPMLGRPLTFGNRNL